MYSIHWRLVDENGMEVFNTCLGCSEPGVQTLVRGGNYTMTVGSKDNPATGIYKLQLINVPLPDEFVIKIGDKIGDGVPGSRAGYIETPGARDVYRFATAPRQKVYFRSLGHSQGMYSIEWRSVDENGMEVFNTCLGCSELGVQTLVRGGNYTMTVGSDRNPATGTYELELAAQQ